MDATSDAKKQLRRTLLARRRLLDPAHTRDVSDAACARLLGLPEWQRARTVAVYAPHLGEVDPEAAISAAGDRRVAWPVVMPGERVLRFYVSPERDALRPSTYGIPAPPTAPEHRVALAEIDLFVVPALAFDPRGERLGYGKGYYDATLAAAGRGAVRVGLAFDWQLVPTVHPGPSDQPVHLVVTDARVLRPAPDSDTRGP